MAADAAACYNRIVAGLHHCYPTDAERIGSILAGEHPGEDLRDETAWVATDGARIVGIAHAGLDDGARHLAGPRGAIRFIACETGFRAAGQALLDAAEGYLLAQGVPEIIAFHQDHRWPCFHLEHAYMPDRLTRIEGLLGYNGYERCAGEVYFDWPNLDPPEIPSCDIEAEFATETFDEGETNMRFVVRAHRGDEMVGQCWQTSCGPSAPGTEAEDWALTTWLQIMEPWQGRRLGAHLLARALHGLREFGFKHAAISTSFENHRAQLFYSNFGYQPSDWTYAFLKKPEGT